MKNLSFFGKTFYTLALDKGQPTGIAFCSFFNETARVITAKKLLYSHKEFLMCYPKYQPITDLIMTIITSCP